MKNYPFHYELKFRLLKNNNPDDIEVQQKSWSFINENPLIAREEAFNELNHWIENLKSTAKIVEQDDKLKIISPIELNEKSFSTKNINPLKFYQELAVFIVLDDKELETNHYKQFDKEFEKFAFLNELNEQNKKNLEENELAYTSLYINEFDKYRAPICIISSNDIDIEAVLLNLEDEIYFYNTKNIDVTGLIEIIEFRGEDYFDEGCDKNLAYHTILKTPINWKSYSLADESKDVEYNDEVSNQNNIDILSWIEEGEGKQIEFKPSLIYNFDTKREDWKNVKYKIAKNICSFLNTDGGILFVGVNDNSEIIGLNSSDYLLNTQSEIKNKDFIKLKFDQLIKYFFHPFVNNFLKTEIKKKDDKDIFVIIIEPSTHPVFLTYKTKSETESTEFKEFYIRGEASSRQICDIEELSDYILIKWGK